MNSARAIARPRNYPTPLERVDLRFRRRQGALSEHQARAMTMATLTSKIVASPEATAATVLNAVTAPTATPTAKAASVTVHEMAHAMALATVADVLATDAAVGVAATAAVGASLTAPIAVATAVQRTSTPN